MELYSQRNPEWGNVRIGKTNMILARWGCTITSLCMLLSKWYKDAEKPPDAARMWKFTNGAEIIWNKTNFHGMAFVWRGYGYNHSRIFEYAKDANKGVVIEVNYNHWVVVVEVNGGGLKIHDPWDGKDYERLPKKYKVTGYALFSKTKRIGEISEFAEESVKKAIDAMVAMKWDNPKEIIGDATMEQMLINMGGLNQKLGNLSKERAAVAFHRLGFFG